MQAGSPEGRNPSGRRHGGCAPARGVQAGSPEGHNPLWQAAWRCPQHMQAGSPEGCNPFGRRHGGCAPALASGESRGAYPLWQGSGGVPQDFLLFPPSFQEGGQGAGPSPIIEAQPPQAGSPEGHNPFGRRHGGVPQHMQAGSPEGCNPTGRRHGGCEPQHMQAGSPEGCNPFGRRYGGCASITYFSLYSPFLPGRGPGGW